MPSPLTAVDIERAAAAIGDIVRPTPILEIPGDELGVEATIVLKLEFVQHSGSFKARGAAHYLATQDIAPAGVIAASGGNHGAAVAWAAHRFGRPANIFVPEVAAPAKIERLRSYGATVHRGGAVYADALAASRAFLEGADATAIHAYDDPVVMAGAGTCAREFEAQAGPLDAVLLACGGGGLSGGAASWLGDRTELVCCETPGTATYAAAVRAGGPVEVEISGLAADALGASRLGANPWAALSAAGARSAIVGDGAVGRAQEFLWTHLRVLVEPAAATPVAVLLERAWQPPAGARVGVVLCGANTARG